MKRNVGYFRGLDYQFSLISSFKAEFALRSRLDKFKNRFQWIFFFFESTKIFLFEKHIEKHIVERTILIVEIRNRI